MVFVPAYVMVGQYFDKHRGKAMALSTMGSGVGNIFFAALIPLLFNTYSFSGLFFILGALQLNHLVSGSVYRPPKQSPVPAATDEEFHDVSLTEKEGVDSKSESYEESSEPSVCVQTLKHVVGLLSNITFCSYAFVIVSMQFCLVVFLIFLPKLALEVGARESNLWYTLVIFGVFDIVGRLAAGFIFDLKPFRQNRSRIFCFVSLMFGVFVVCYVIAQSFVIVCLLTALVAIFEGAVHSQRTTVITEFVYKEQVPLAVGFVIFCQGIGNLTGPGIAGLLTDNFGTSRYGFAVGGLLLVISSVLFFVARVTRK